MQRFRLVLVQRELLTWLHNACSWQSTMYKSIYSGMPPGYKSEVTEAEWETRIWNNQFVIKHAFLITSRGAVAMRQNSHGLNEAGWFICLHWADCIDSRSLDWLASDHVQVTSKQMEQNGKALRKQALPHYNEFHTSPALTWARSKVKDVEEMILILLEFSRQRFLFHAML